MSRNKTYKVLLPSGVAIGLTQHGEYGYIDYFDLPESGGRPRDWDLIRLALKGASYDGLQQLAKQRPVGLSGKYQYHSAAHGYARSHEEAYERRVERAQKRARDIAAEITRQTGLTLKKASAKEIDKEIEFLAGVGKLKTRKPKPNISNDDDAR